MKDEEAWMKDEDVCVLLRKIPGVAVLVARRRPALRGPLCWPPRQQLQLLRQPNHARKDRSELCTAIATPVKVQDQAYNAVLTWLPW